MIISVSRRTDIPAFYSEWFYNRIQEGYVLVKNPYNRHKVSKINLKPDAVDCIVFWTKNPTPMLEKLDLLKNYQYYFQFTVNPYNEDIEKGVPKKKYIVDSFIKLSKEIGKKKVIWRYDPILLTDQIDKEYHYKYFDYLASYLKDYTDKCIISFVDLYKKIRGNLKSVNVVPLTEKDMREIAITLSHIARKYNLVIESCSETVDLSDIGINHGKCIDDKLISEIYGMEIDIKKDPNQREICGCVKSKDIGAYNTCLHNCLYCYANYSKKVVQKNTLEHDPQSPLLFGHIEEDDKITECKPESYICREINLFKNLND